MQPKMSAKAPRVAAASEPAVPIGFDRAWATFRREEGDRFARALLTLPAGPGTAIRIRSWGKDSTLDTTRDEFRVDAVTGQLVSAERYADKTFGEKIIANVLDIHRGAVLGWPGKLAFMIAAALMPLFSVTGILLYLSRRKLRRPAQPPLGRLVPGE
jgi:sulfite reductase (NADPH) flavoprotein alpha-component